LIGVILWTAQETAGLAVDALNAIKSMGHTTSTTVTKVVTATSNAAVRKLTVAVGTLTHVTIPGLRHRVDALAHRVNVLAHSAGHAIASPIPRVGRVEHDLSGLRRRVGKLEKQLAAGVGVALLVRALAKAGLSWLRC